MRQESPTTATTRSLAFAAATAASKPALEGSPDRAARREALRYGLNFIGTARLLHLAESRSLIEDAAVVVQRMVGYGYRISSLLLQQLKA